MNAMRMIIVAGLLMMALLVAVLGAVAVHNPALVSAPDEDKGQPSREISDRLVPGSSLMGTPG